MSTAHEFILIPKEVYIQDKPIPQQIIYDPDIKAKAKQLSLLQRTTQPGADDATESTAAQIAAEQSVKDFVFEQLEPLFVSDAQKRKSEFIYQLIERNERISVDKSGSLTIDGTKAGISASTFLFHLQQTNKKFDVDLYKTIINILNIPEHVVPNTYAKQIIKEREEAPRAKRQRGKDESAGAAEKQWTPTKKVSPWKDF